MAKERLSFMAETKRVEEVFNKRLAQEGAQVESAREARDRQMRSFPLHGVIPGR